MGADFFREIPGWPEYQVSTRGIVRRVKPACGTSQFRVLKWNLLKAGYAKVSLCRNAKRREYLVHRLVAMTFIADPGDLDVCHCDGDKQNNAVENLRIDTRKGNMADQIAFGLTPRGERSGSNKYSREFVLSLRDRLDRGESVRSVSNDSGVPKSTLYSMRLRNTWGWL